MAAARFGAGEGWTNLGVMAFSGTSDVFGDVDNQAGGQFVISGNATTTFFDDVTHNGLEIRTSAGSNTVIFGEASGAGAYTGTGSVFLPKEICDRAIVLESSTSKAASYLAIP